jgi:DNA-binding transcriptional ArsR family regulator
MSKVEEENQTNKEKELAIRVEDSVEILTTDDERLSIIGEELSNETGRAVLSKLFEGTNSISDIASGLNISIPLVRWHIMRLSKVGLIKISNTKLSQKNKPVKYYEPAKFALIIIPSSVTKSTVYSELLKSGLKKIYKYLPAFATFVAGTTGIYLLKTSSQPDTYSFTIRALDGNQLFFISSDLAMSLIGGILFAIAVIFSLRWRNSKKRKPKLIL